MSFDLKAYLSERKHQVDEFLEAHFSSLQAPATLKESMLYSLAAGGKRVRPILALAAAHAVGGKQQTVLPFAAALEAIHTYTLIHDDLPAMDDDDLRRGKPTNHKVFGEATAILAGDGLLTQAFHLMASASPELSAELRLTIIRRVADAVGAGGMVGGQLLDMEHEDKQPTLESLKAIHTGKTGRLLTVSVEVGALAAGVVESELTPFTQYGYHLGYAFQIYDDVLDVIGGDEIGKSQKSDLENKKATFVAFMGVDAAKALALEEIKKAIAEVRVLGDNATPLIELAHYIVSRKN